MVWGVFLTCIRLIYSEFNKESKIVMHNLREELRIKLGSYILLGLEVLIVADVVESIANPSYEELIILGGIVLIRTVMGYFLRRSCNLMRTICGSERAHENHLTVPCSVDYVFLDLIRFKDISPSHDSQSAGFISL